MSDYYKDELLSLVKDWPVDRLDMYITELEQRITDTREVITTLKQVRKRRLSKQPKDTGSRGGK